MPSPAAQCIALSLARRFAGHLPLIGLCIAAAQLAGCRGSARPSARPARIHVPVPQNHHVAEADEPPAPDAPPPIVQLSPRRLIQLAFHRQPDIKSSYQQFKTEEARYDFFYASNDQLTPRIAAANTMTESRDYDPATGLTAWERERAHAVEIGVDKQFFDTTEFGVASGYEAIDDDGETANQPFVTARLRYPLWESREKLERASEDIFRQNELNDAQLNYIRQTRNRLQQALNKFYYVVDLRTRLDSAQRWEQDLIELADRVAPSPDLGVTLDLRRVQADLARAAAEARNLGGLYEIELARLKYACGLPYEVPLKLRAEPFNPFAGATHAALRTLSLETDPEIATLRNAMRNAEVQLDLARRGKWDVALLLSGKTRFRGGGAFENDSEWSASAGLEVSAIDPRVTSSLQRQARASIERFRHAIAARENLIYADTLEPLVRIDTLSASRDELRQNLERYRDNYESGVAEYLAGNLSIDDLLARRETIFSQEVQIASLTSLVGYNVSELCAATGKFFELLENGHQEPPAEPSRG